QVGPAGAYRLVHEFVYEFSYRHQGPGRGEGLEGLHDHLAVTTVVGRIAGQGVAKVPEGAGYLVGGGSPLACLGPSSGVSGEVVGVLQDAAVEFITQQHPGQDPRRDLHRCDGAKALAQLFQEFGDGDIGLSVQRDRCFTSRGDRARGGGRTAGRVEVVGTHSGATPSVPARMDGESGTWLRGTECAGVSSPAKQLLK